MAESRGGEPPLMFFWSGTLGETVYIANGRIKFDGTDVIDEARVRVFWSS